MNPSVSAIVLKHLLEYLHISIYNFIKLKKKLLFDENNSIINLFTGLISFKVFKILTFFIFETIEHNNKFSLHPLSLSVAFPLFIFLLNSPSLFNSLSLLNKQSSLLTVLKDGLEEHNCNINLAA